MGWYRFGEFELDLDAFALKRGGEHLAMQPKVLDVLRYLVEHRGRMVSKTELLDHLWADEYVNEAVVTWSVSHIRRALGQQRGDKRPIETVHGRGYRWTAEVTSGQSAAPAASAPPPLAAPSSTLVGRGRIMSELLQRVQDAMSGRGGLCVLTGEAGIGKTRCAQELMRSAGALGVQAYWGRCPQEPSTPPLWPVATALSSLANRDPALAARARELMGGGGDDASAEAESHAGGARFWLLEQVAHLLRDLSAKQPALLVLDDVHWADASTLRLLGFLAPELGEVPLCIVLTMRDDEREAASAGGRPLALLLRHAHAIPLGALDAAQVAELVEAMGGRRPSEALAEAVRRAAGGVPLFVTEVVRSLLLEHGAEALDALSPDAVRVPELARDLLRQRMLRLPEPTIELLSRAAAIGDRFDLSLLAALVELEPEALLDGLEPAIVEGQLESEAPHTYRFVHSLFHSVLYDDLPPGTRVSIHRKIATLLQGAPGDELQHGEIARHYYLSLPAGEPDKVVQSARAAGHAAMRVFAFEDAALYYGWALEAQAFGGAPEPRARAELLNALAIAQRVAGRTNEAIETSARVIHLARQHRMYDLVVRATRLRRPTVAMAMLPDGVARSALEFVLQHLPEGADPVRISALSQLACLPPYERDLSRSKELSTRALALAEQQADREVLFEALRARLFSLSGPDDIEEVLQVADRMLSLHDSGAPSWHSGDARGARFAAHMLAGRIADADAALDTMAAAVPGPQWPEAIFYVERLRAQRLFLDGRFDQAERRWAEVARQALRAGVAYAEFFHGVQIVNLMLVRSGPQEVVRRRMALWQGILPGMTPAYRAGVARIAAEAGELDFARAQLSSLGDPANHPRDGAYLHMLASLAVCAATVGDRARCEQLLALLSPYPHLNTPDAMGFYTGSVSHFLGVLAAALGRSEQADAHFEQALRQNRAMGYRVGVVRSTLARGQLARRLGQHALAGDLFASARAEAEALGMRAAVADADEALSQQRAP